MSEKRELLPLGFLVWFETESGWGPWNDGACAEPQLALAAWRAALRATPGRAVEGLEELAKRVGALKVQGVGTFNIPRDYVYGYEAALGHAVAEIRKHSAAPAPEGEGGLLSQRAVDCIMSDPNDDDPSVIGVDIALQPQASECPGGSGCAHDPMHGDVYAKPQASGETPRYAIRKMFLTECAKAGRRDRLELDEFEIFERGFKTSEREALARRDEVRELYNELLYAVGKKFPGESRHETALRYIRQAEEDHSQSASTHPKAEGPSE